MNLRQNTVWFIEKAKEIHGSKYDYSKSEYINSRIKICIICPEHGEFWQTSSNHFNSVNCCSVCANISRSNKEKNSTVHFIRKAKEIHGDKYDYSKVVYKNNYSDVCIICPDHGDFFQPPNRHTTFKSGCPQCRESKGERLIKRWLRDNNIMFESEYRFSDCRNSLPLPFDFYLPELNTCIEYDGIQHFKPIDRFGGTEVFNRTLENDRIKESYCEDNSISLIRVRYDQNVPEVLSELFQSGN